MEPSNVAYGAGFGLGKWFNTNMKNANSIMAAALVLGTILLLGFFIMACIEVKDSRDQKRRKQGGHRSDEGSGIINTTMDYFRAFAHHKCKRGGACSGGCPYVSSDDPRAAMCTQVDTLKHLVGVMTQDAEVNVAAVRAIIDDRLKLGKTDATYQKVEEISSYRDSCVTYVTELVKTAEAIKDQHAKSDTITPEVIKAKNRVSAIDATVAVLLDAFAATIVHLNTFALHARIKAVPKADHYKVTAFDNMVIECENAVTFTEKNHSEMMKITVQSDFAKNIISLQRISADVNEENAMINRQAEALNLGRQTRPKVVAMLAKLELVQKNYSIIFRQVEAFSNALPGKLSNDAMTKLIASGDYNKGLVQTALESDIVSNHHKYANDRSRFDSGGGVPAVRDDDNDLIQWVGVFGRPTYKRTDGASADEGSVPLTSIPSQNPVDLMRKVPTFRLA